MTQHRSRLSLGIPRRNFLASAAASAISPWLARIPWTRSPDLVPDASPACVLLDLQARCVLPESLQGYASALALNSVSLTQLHSFVRPPRLVIVPGAGSFDAVVATNLLQCLAAGTNVLLESGAAFCSPSEFAAHQKLLRDYFGLQLGAPVDLWRAACNSVDHAIRDSESRRHPGAAPLHPVPYVHYLWPCAATVRDFSRIIPVSSNTVETIGRVGESSVAVKKRLRNALLIFLGSPLGPALRAGDPQAKFWLRQVASA